MTMIVKEVGKIIPTESFSGVRRLHNKGYMKSMCYGVIPLQKIYLTVTTLYICLLWLKQLPVRSRGELLVCV